MTCEACMTVVVYIVKGFSRTIFSITGDRLAHNTINRLYQRREVALHITTMLNVIIILMVIFQLQNRI